MNDADKRMLTAEVEKSEKLQKALFAGGDRHPAHFALHEMTEKVKRVLERTE